jgi:cysteine-rich repeat protein
LLIAVSVACACGGSEEGGGGGIATHTRANQAPAWAVPYGAEFWRPSHGVDVQDAIARVSHAFRGTEVRSAGYTARVDGSGLRFEAGGSELRLTSRVNGRESGDVPWSIVGDTAQGLLAPGLIEHYQARDEGVEVSWVIAERGAIDIEASFDGLVVEGSAHDIHFVDQSGARVAKLGAAVLVDQAGHRWPIEPGLDGSVVRYRVGADIVASAEFPVALDPVVGPERTPDAPVIGSAPGVQSAPSMASNGAVSLVVWEDTRSGPTNIWAARISPQGEVLDPAGIALAEQIDEQNEPRVATNGSSFLVTWNDLRSDVPGVYVARISAAGAVLDRGGVRVALSQSSESDPAVASDGSDYLVAWRSGAHVAASRVTAAGVVLDPGGFQLSTAAAIGAPSLASSGDGYLAVWSEDLGTTASIRGTRVTAAGTALDPLGIAIATGASPQTVVAVASNGSGYLVAWDDLQDVLATRVTPAGSVLDPTGILVGEGNTAAIASDGTDYLVAWQYFRSSPGNGIAASRVTAAGAALDPDPMILGVHADATMRNPSMAFDGSRYVVAWGYASTVHGEGDVQAIRVTTDGVVDPSPVLVSTAHVAQDSPAIAVSATEMLVAWIDGRAGKQDVYIARLSPAGIPLDPAGVLVSQFGTSASPTVASNGSDFLITWTDVYAGGEQVATVTSAGVVNQTVRLGAVTTQVATASDGNGYLVVVADAGSITAAHITATGDFDVYPFEIASGASSAQPAVAWAGGSFVVVWSAGTTATGRDIFAARVSATGEIVQPPFAVSAASNDQQRPAITASDSELLIVWDDKRDALLSDVYGARVSFDGTVLDPAGIPILTSEDTETDCSVASSGSEYLVACQANHDTTDVVGARVTTAGTVGDDFAISASVARETSAAVTYSPASAAYLAVYNAYGYLHDRFIAFTGCGDGIVDIAETCDDGGTVDGDGCSATCQIEMGYACSGGSCSDVDECATNNGGCADTCTNTVGGFVCSCGPGYVLDVNGHNCDTTDVNECATSNGGCTQACTNTVDGFACSCASGYALASDGVGCDEIDECMTNNGGCAETCTNTPGSYVCSCAVGYQVASDGHSCEDIDECATHNGACTQICTNTPGSHVCGCQAGYMLDTDGSTCIDINECVAGTDDCDPFAFCINTIGSHECTCDEGYTGDGFTCEPVDPPDGGCGCRTTDARGSWLLVVVCLGALRRRRR